MPKFLKGAAVAAALVMCMGTAHSAEIVFSGVSATSDDYQLGVVWSGLAREAGISFDGCRERHRRRYAQGSARRG